MSYTALYRKFRPAEFEDVKGQDHIITTLRNQIKAERIGHAYLFCGPEEPERLRWRRYLPERSIVSIRWMEVPAENVRCAKVSPRARL